ncbi:MAG: hypothetical protein Q9191_001168 [Dirinaria sp. TL-2023a]
MSSAYGEAEDGHAHSTSTANEGDDQDNVETNAEYGADDLVELSRPTVSSQSESEPEKSEDENSLSIAEKADYDRESDITKDASQGAHVAATHLLGDGRPSSADGSLSIPDDSPSIQGSATSSTGRRFHSPAYGSSPTPSLRPFDRRFQARLSSSPANSYRASSPAFLDVRSRQSSVSHSIRDIGDAETNQAPWDVVRWTKLRKITGQACSEIGKRNFGKPTCIAVSASIALGTSKGIILVFDYNQDLKSIIGPGSKAVECGAVTSISISADLSTIAGGHASGHIFTWELAKPAKPFLQIVPIDQRRNPEADGHFADAAVLHVGFLGTRHTALVSADDKGMAFSHLATRGMGIVARTVRTTRILGRYPNSTQTHSVSRKPSSVLAFSPLSLGNAEHAADTMGLVAMLTPYLLVIVSTTPIAQTQYKTARPKELAHTAMSAALAWFPSVKLKAQDSDSAAVSRAKLVYCWSNILTVLEVVEVEPSEPSEKDAAPSLQFRPRSRWKAEEAIVAVQWLGRSVLAILTITQQLVILEDNSLRMTDTSDLIPKHIYHRDLFSQHLSWLVETLDEEDTSMHGVVADAYYMSFRAYKGRLFLLGYNEVCFGTMSNWADRLLALMEEGKFISAIELATSYYVGKGEKVTVGLPENDTSRHNLVNEKLLEMISASLKFAFGKNKIAQDKQLDSNQLEDLAAACIDACSSTDDLDFLCENVYPWYEEARVEGIFLETLEPHILDGGIESLPPTMIKDLVGHYTSQGLGARLEEILCHLDSHMMDIDQITSLCKRNGLWDALLYVWSQALNDYTSILDDLLASTLPTNGASLDSATGLSRTASASKVFPYLSCVLTGRIYPTGKEMIEEQAFAAKAEVYHYFFPRSTKGRAHESQYASHTSVVSYPKLRRVLDFDAPSFLTMLNEAFEDSFLDGQHPQAADGSTQNLNEEQTSGSPVKRQTIVDILLDVMSPPNYEPDDTVYLDMFIARNLPKFPQFILLSGRVLHSVLKRLCEFPDDGVAEDCQLSVEYLLSAYQPPDLPSLIPLIHDAHFYRVLKSIYRADRQYAKLLETCFEDASNPDAIFECIGDCLRPSTGLNGRQIDDVRQVLIKSAPQLAFADPVRAASIIDQYAKDLHPIMLQALDEDERAQLNYLQTLLEPRSEAVNEGANQYKKQHLIEQYVRLLCIYDPHHVSEYVEHLNSGDLRLDQVLPALESSGVVDAAIVLMAREGRVRDGIDRFTQHLRKLKAALVGLLEGAQAVPDAANATEAIQHLAGSIQKYVRVGIWLCRGQTKSLHQSKAQLKTLQRSENVEGQLSVDEKLWLDLIDAVVAITRDVSEIIKPTEDENEEWNTQKQDEDPAAPTLRSSQVVAQLRTVVQEAFTALLATTNAPRTPDVRRADAPFLRILRAFLGRASMSSSSLSNLRSVLSAIFSAYAYEESLLALANRLLDKDLFAHLNEADTLRRRGWRPLGQVCEGCGKRAWGPGTGVHVWEAWKRQNEKRAHQPHESGKAVERGSDMKMGAGGKGKAATAGHGKVVAVPDGGPEAMDGRMMMGGQEAGSDERNGKEDLGALAIFACRHMFHRQCLVEMQGTEDRGETGNAPRGSLGPELACPLCTH